MVVAIDNKSSEYYTSHQPWNLVSVTRISTRWQHDNVGRWEVPKWLMGKHHSDKKLACQDQYPAYVVP